MSYILGIDTGGTYTDGVLLDFEGKKIVQKAKAFTTHQDLTVGIEECIHNMGTFNPSLVKMVCLSTTLATNSIVEGRGCRVGLIMIGFNPPGKLPAQKIYLVSGGHHVNGTVKNELDLAELDKAIREMGGHVDTLAVSALLSIRNPEHEIQAKKIIQGQWNIPIVCAHELSSTLGFYERTVTACLNARLLPVISDLMAASRLVLRKNYIQAPIMIVKGDGSLISEAQAMEKPVETILSGPAASVVGATFLTGLETVLSLDMGGTTTDIGIVKHNRWRMNQEGAVVAGWRTHVATAEISTFGLGGDSYITVPQNEQLNIGPARVWPLSVTAARFPYLVEELNQVRPLKTSAYGQTADCWMILRFPSNPNLLSESEQAVIHLLKDGPHNIQILEEQVSDHLIYFALKSLEQARIIGRISFTPTDALHCLGIIRKWNTSAARAGARLLAAKYNCSSYEFPRLCLAKITESLSLAVLQSIASQQGYDNVLMYDAKLKFMLASFFQHDQKTHDFELRINLNYPIAAIGAPVDAYLPAVGKLLDTEVIIPEHSEVANAVGAAVGKVSERIYALIKPGFAVHAPWGYTLFYDLEEARESILNKGKEAVMINAQKAGVPYPEIIINRDELITETPAGKVFIEERWEIIATGYPHFQPE